MPMSQWPCQADSLEDIMSENLIKYILAGASEQFRLPLAIVDGNNRYDPFNERQQASPFCRRLRGVKIEKINGIEGADTQCQNWDEKIAKMILANERINTGEPIFRSCWLKLSDYVIKETVGDHPFILFTGQFIPELKKEIAIAEISETIRKEFEPSQKKVNASENEIDELIKLIPYQPIVNDEKLKDIKQCSNNILQQFENQWKLKRNEKEDNIYREIIAKLQLIHVIGEKRKHVDWDKVNSLLKYLCSFIGCSIAILFVKESYHGLNEDGQDNVLKLCAAYGLNFQVPRTLLYFKWKKNQMERYNDKCVFDEIESQVIRQGIKKNNSLDPSKIDLWYPLIDEETGYKSIIGLGGFDNLSMVRVRTGEFLIQILSSISKRIQVLQLYADVLGAEEFNMELAEFLAHQVRTKLQSFYAYHDVFLNYSRGEKSLEEFSRASTHFGHTIEDLSKLTKVVQAAEPILYNRNHMMLEEVDPWTAIEAAMDDQAYYADQRKIEFQWEEYNLPTIMVDTFWFRIMLGHLMNNAIKYSLKARDGNLRWVEVKAELLNNQICISIENFGLGILANDIKKIFEAGETASEKGQFVNRPGHKRGLYEVRRLAYVHKHKINVISKHHTGGPVNTSNIENCLTTFHVIIPITNKDGSHGEKRIY